MEYIKAFCRTYSRQEDPIFDDFYAFLSDLKYDEEGKEKADEQLDKHLLKDIYIALHPYSLSGDHPRTLNSRDSINLMADDFCLFEIGDLMESPDKTYSRLCLFSIIHCFDIMMRQDVSSLKILVIEEAWKALSNKDMQPYLNSLWKTSRKYNTCAIVVTQQMSDIISSDIIKDTIIANSPVKIILDQRECVSELDEVVKVLGLTETDKRLIRSLNSQGREDRSKDVFVKIGQGKSGAFKVEVSKQEAFLYESVLKNKSELNKTIKSGKSVLSLLKSIQ